MTRFLRAFACAAALLLIGGGLLLVHSAGISRADGGNPTGNPTVEPTMSGTPTPSESPSPSASPSASPTDEPACAKRTVSQYFYGLGFERSDVSVGSRLVDWSQVDSSHVDDPFSSRPLKSHRALLRFLTADTAASRAAREIMGDPADDYVAVQFNSPIIYSGNWFWSGYEVRAGADNLRVRGGDVWWVAVDGCEISTTRSIRAICGNVGFTRLTLLAARTK